MLCGSCPGSLRFVGGRGLRGTLVRVAQLVRALHDMTHATPLAGDQGVVCRCGNAGPWTNRARPGVGGEHRRELEIFLR